MSRPTKSKKTRIFSPPRAPAIRPGPEGGARDQNRRARARKLCAAGLALFLEHGLDVASIDQIARRAGIGKASFYAYFHDKEELVATLLAPFRARALAAMDACLARIRAAAGFEQFARAQELMAAELLATFTDNLDVLRLLLQEARGPASGARRPIRAFYDELVERAVAHNQAARAAGLIRDIHPRVVAFINLGAIERLAVGMLAGAELGAPADVARSLSEVMLAGLRRPR